MLLLLVTSLAISTPATADVDAGAAPECGEALVLPPVPEGLPVAGAAPANGHWTGVDGRDGGAGVFLPQRLAMDVLERLEFLERVPRLVDVRMSCARAECDVRVKHAVDRSLAEDEARRAKVDAQAGGGVTVWQAVVVGVAMLFVGGAVGGGAVLVLR